MRSHFIAAVSSATVLAVAALTLGGCIAYTSAPAQPTPVLVTPAPPGTVVVPAR
jgi:hypothetical protein